MKGAEELEESDEDPDLASAAQNYLATAGASTRSSGGGQEGREGGSGAGEAGGVGGAREGSSGDPTGEVGETNPWANTEHDRDSTCLILVEKSSWKRFFSLECALVPIDDTYGGVSPGDA